MDRLRIHNGVRFLLIILMIVIGAGSVIFTQRLVRALAAEERKKTEIWAEATTYVARPELSEEEVGFYLHVIRSNTTIPVVRTDAAGELLYSNLDSARLSNPLALDRTLRRMAKSNEPIRLSDNQGVYSYVYYNHSLPLRMLMVYPYVYLLLVLLFITVGFYALRAAQRAEQNHVWVGLSKETAHQLGTPISSLMALTELLREKVSDLALIVELEKDLSRLQMIADRFSKIGSRPVLVPDALLPAIENTLSYMRKRSSGRVTFSLHGPHALERIPLNQPLFGWVIENLCKNAIDAMAGSGSITVQVADLPGKVCVDVTDTGKGIARSLFETVFRPGYTSKSRGWGLGLSLARRIIESYHGGRIFVLRSEIDKGTTFRIELKKEATVV
ncbi:MAG: PAS domain-containing sensor histidine kinase [Bacteroidales bacterium]